MNTPADLDEQVTKVRDALHALRRTLLDLERTYADLDANALDVDTLGIADADLDVAKRLTARLTEHP
ncbi:hypothetical protein EEB14_46500 [Rhodococcus sp. WS4]|nr:hypothetical protein EEB14_46500 [Rhodococcus sp. WS4]